MTTRILTISLPNLDAVTVLGRALLRLADNGTVITLSGSLGAGKTTLARALIQAALGPEEEVPSPTFTLVQTYDMPSGVTIWHFDLYRLTTPEEALELGIEDAFSEGISLIEWPERLGVLQPLDRLDISLLSTKSSEIRYAHLRGYGRWAMRLCQVARTIIEEADMMATGEADTPEASRVPEEARQQVITRFLCTYGCGQVVQCLLRGDASFRRYHRLITPDGTRLVLMDAPPPHENVCSFVRIARHLNSLGFSVPTVVAVDEAAGLLLLEDLGDNTYTRLLAAGADEKALYQRAVDVLIALHRYPSAQAIPPDTPTWDSDNFLAEVNLLIDWYLPALTGAPVAAEVRAAYKAAWHRLFDLAVHESLVLRDFHVDNLMGLPDRPGIRACGLLDFQDAVVGPVTYDVMSLLEDARRDIDPALVVVMTRYYLAAFPALDPDAFAISWAALAAQRHARVIGLFTRLYIRDGKIAYLQHIPRVWRLLERACCHPALAAVAEWFDHYVPPLLRRVPIYPPSSAGGTGL